MKILETRVMRGPSQWSVKEKKLIVLKVSVDEIRDVLPEKTVEEYPHLFPAAIAGEPDRPELMPFLLAHLALWLQQQAGMRVTHASVEEANKPGEYFVIYGYEVEQAGVEAAQQAAALINGMCLMIPPAVDKFVAELRRLRSHYSFGPTSRYILDEVERRGIPFRQFENSSLVTLGYGNRQRKLRTAVTSCTSGLGIEMAGDKEETKRILDEANCPVPRGIVVYSEAELRSRISEVRFPLVIKPLDGNHGRGVTTNISSVEEAAEAYSLASRISSEVIVEEFVQGSDYRFLVINFKMVAAARRSPACVRGDGISTVKRLIESENENEMRGSAEHQVLARIKVDQNTKKMLDMQGLGLDSVPERGRLVILKDTANISSGGTAEDVTEQVHPANVFMVERIARLFNLDICGVDIIAKTVAEPVNGNNGAIIEVNAGPGLRMHSNPQKGMARDIASPIIDMLFPSAEQSRIPLVAVTGTNGKTTTTRLIGHLASAAGYLPGYCTSDGIYINHFQVRKGDCTGALSAANVLFDPSVDFAVLECARGGIIRNGLGFDACDFAVITNITEDHLGLKDIHSLKELCRVKGTIARAVAENGWAVLNSGDEILMELRSELKCRVALFCAESDNLHLRKHREQGGTCATVENGELVIYHQGRHAVMKIIDIPLTFAGQAQFMVMNALAATLVAWLSGFDVHRIQAGLSTFEPGPQNTPGRLNKFDFGKFSILVDYAHNTDGFRKVTEFIAALSCARKTGIIAVAGDRRESDINEIGKTVAGVFDRIILRHNREERGRGNAEVCRILRQAILRENGQAQLLVIEDEEEALRNAVAEASEGELIFACADKVPDTIEMVQELQQHFENKLADTSTYGTER